jgi:hypothetical protein
MVSTDTITAGSDYEFVNFQSQQGSIIIWIIIFLYLHSNFIC